MTKNLSRRVARFYTHLLARDPDYNMNEENSAEDVTIGSNTVL